MTYEPGDMDNELQQYLDGDLPREALPDELRREAERWEDLIASFRAGDPGAGADAPPWLEARIREAVADARAPGPWWRKFWRWLVAPRSVEVSPLSGLAAAAAVALVAVFLGRGALGPAAPGVPDGAADQVAVRFTLEAPDARSVALAGDFSGWDPAAELTDADGDGVWTGRVILPPGVHQYMFLVNGERWVTDPAAERYVDDGFGRQNAVLALAETGDESS